MQLHFFSYLENLRNEQLGALTALQVQSYRIYYLTNFQVITAYKVFERSD